MNPFVLLILVLCLLLTPVAIHRLLSGTPEHKRAIKQLQALDAVVKKYSTNR